MNTKIKLLPEEGEIFITKGEAWVTFAGDAQDYFLVAGERFSLQGKKKGLLEPTGGEVEYQLFPEEKKAKVYKLKSARSTCQQIRDIKKG